MKKQLIVSLALLTFVSSLALTSLAKAEDQSTNNTVPKNQSLISSLKSALQKKPVDPACAKTALTTRETAIMAGADAFTTAWKAALNARKTALLAAWDLTDAKARRAAIKKAWQDYNKSILAAKKAWRTSRNAAWTQYRKDIKACGPKTVSADMAPESLGLQDLAL